MFMSEPHARKKQNKQLGNSGEEMAIQFLKQNGYHVLEKNYRTSFGEIDIIAEDRDTICFVEVKTRASVFLSSPFEAVSETKQRKLSQMAFEYLRKKNQMECRARFDAIAILFSAGENVRIELVKNAFEVIES